MVHHCLLYYYYLYVNMLNLYTGMCRRLEVLNSASITRKGLGYTFILQSTVEVVVVDNVAGSDLLYCNNDPH